MVSHLGMELLGSKCILRTWRRGDEPSLVKNANNKKIWRNLRDVFPHPYTRRDAAGWITFCESAEGLPHNLAISVDGEAVGGVGINPGIDVFRRTAEIGYWLGEAYWGQGIATDALRLMTGYAFSRFDLLRLEAGVFSWNPASARVLEKAGFAFEGRFRSNVFKDGEMTDRLFYARLRSDWQEEQTKK